MKPTYEQPWHLTPGSKYYFYHTMHYPDGETIKGSFTIDDFVQYVGGYPLKGKTVLDIGTASGFIAFNAEMAGADVTGLDAVNAREFRHFPFKETDSYRDIVQSRKLWDETNILPIKNSWWYGWHKYKSNAKCIYAPHADLYEWDQEFDVVIAGAIVEHLSDPVYAIGAWTKIAREAVLIPFTDVAALDDLAMYPITSLDDPSKFYVWWHLSRGLYVKLFDNLGFDVSFTKSHALLHNTDGDVLVPRSTIVATRRR